MAQDTSTPPRIAICYFGITRSLARTLPSIEAQILAPARALGETRSFAHFFQLARIENPRTGESLDVDAEEHRLLGLDEVELEAPGACLALWPFEELKAYGDETGDDFKTMSNLIHQLHSLHRVGAMAADWAPDLYVFCRPDLEYHDSLGPCLKRALAGPEACHVPYWQWRGGLNDRFAVIRGAEIAARYAGRIHQVLPYCQKTGRPLHAETLLRFAMEGLPVRRFSVRATRVRADGSTEYESFQLNGFEDLHTAIKQSRAPELVKRLTHRLLNEAHRVVELAIPK